MKTMQEEWRAYRDAIYPRGISAVQNRECHQAFFAAALIAVQKMDEISRLPEDQAVKELQKFTKEILEVCEARAAEGKP